MFVRLKAIRYIGRNSCVTVFGIDVGLHIFADSFVPDGMDCCPTTDSALLLLW